MLAPCVWQPSAVKREHAPPVLVWLPCRTKSAGRWLDLALGVRVQVEAGGHLQIPATPLHPLSLPLFPCAPGPLWGSES
jgi:hypothetical protein